MRHPVRIAATALLVAAPFAAALLATATPAAASVIASPSLDPNYTFPDGSQGFGLSVSTSDGSNTLTSDGLLLPAVLVAFNPQPDPPGTPPTTVSFTDPTNPTFFNGSTGLNYVFEMSFLNLMPDGCHASSFVSTSGFRSCTGMLGNTEVTLGVSLIFTGPGGLESAVAFNPQPDPPGDVFGLDVTFQGVPGENIDPSAQLLVTVNGTPLDFGLPEPGTLSLFATALVGLAAWRRRRRLT